MDERATDFVAAFKAFLEEVVSDHRTRQDSDGQALLPQHVESLFECFRRYCRD